MHLKIKYWIFGLVIIAIILVSGCAQQQAEKLKESPQPTSEEVSPAVLENGSPTISIPEVPNATSKAPVESNQTEPVLTFEQAIWKKRIDAAMAPSYCPPIEKQEYPKEYYQGPLIDTHVHIPDIPEWSPEEDNAMKAQEIDGRFGGTEAFLGWNVNMADIACTLQHGNTQKNFAFFPTYDDDPPPKMQFYLWKETMARYPERFTPFIMSAGDDDEPGGFPTVDAKTLKSMLAIYPGLFEGYGEIGLYEREDGGSPALSPDSQRMQEIYPLIRQNKLAVYIHLGDNQKSSFERVLKQNPDINFIWHGDQLSMDEIEDVLSKHPNAFYGIEGYQVGRYRIFPLFVGKDKQAYVDAMTKDFDGIVNAAAQTWKSFIERHPDQVLWGTDIGDTVWNYDRDAYEMMTRFARAFIGKLDQSVQEKFAYKNAEKLIENR